MYVFPVHHYTPKQNSSPYFPSIDKANGRLCQKNFVEIRKLCCRRHFRNEKGTGVEMLLAIISGIVTDDMLVSYWLIFFLFLVTVPEVFTKVNSAQVLSRF